MNRGGKVVQAMQQIVALLAAGCSERATLDELATMLASSRQSWPGAHELFQRIRQKTLAAERQKDKKLVAQYLFEEVFAKTLYNLSGKPAPFDADSPYWIIPNALAFGNHIDIAPEQIIGIISA